MPTFLVQRVRDGRELTSEKILARDAQSAATQIVGELLVKTGQPGTHVARVRSPKSLDWTLFYLPQTARPASLRARASSSTRRSSP